MVRVQRMEVRTGAFRSDHFPVTMDLRMRADEAEGHSRNALHFFRVSMDVALSAAGSVGVRDILQKWQGLVEPATPLRRLELALEECRAFLQELGKELICQRRVRETQLRKGLEALLL